MDHQLEGFERADEPDDALRHWLSVLHRRRFGFVVVLTVVTVVGTVVMALGSSQLQASSSVMVDENLAVPGTSSTGTSTFNRQAQIEIANSPLVAERVTEQLGHPATISVSTSSTDDLVLFQAAESSGKEAALVANTYAKAFQSVLQDETAKRFDQAISAIDLVVEDAEAQLNAATVDTTRTRLQAELDAYQTARSDLQVQAALAPLGVARIVAPAAEPIEVPTYRKLVGPLFVSLILGLLCAVIFVLAAEALDSTIRGGRDAIPPSIPILGTVPAWGSGLAPLDYGSGPEAAGADIERAKAFLLLRNALMLRMPEDGCLLHVVGASDQDRAAEVAANLAVAFANSGLSTLAVDLDPVGSLTSLLLEPSAEPRPDPRVARSTTSLSQVHGVANLAVLAPGTSFGGDLLYRSAESTLLNEILDRKELVIVVTGPLMADPSASAMSTRADLTLVVLTAHGTQATDARRAFDTLRLRPGVALAAALIEP